MAAVMITLSTSAGGMASAATVTPTSIRFTPDTLTIGYTNRQVAIQGTLQSSSGSPAGESIDLRELRRGGPTELGVVTTASDGTFSLTTTLPGLGSVQAQFAGDATYGPSNWADRTFS